MLAWEGQRQSTKAISVLSDDVDSRWYTRGPSHFFTADGPPNCTQSEADLVFVAAFRVCANDLVSLSLWSGYLHPAAAHSAVVRD
jgi:hypothetical protein